MNTSAVIRVATSGLIEMPSAPARSRMSRVTAIIVARANAFTGSRQLAGSRVETVFIDILVLVYLLDFLSPFELSGYR